LLAWSLKSFQFDTDPETDLTFTDCPTLNSTKTSVAGPCL
jgi:hypothetical protein